MKNGTTSSTKTLRDHFSDAAQVVSRAAGHPAAFLAAVAIVIVWGASGPLFGYSDTWQLVINTGTTIVTFLMVFLIQNTQNRDTLALHLKLSELVFAVKGARNEYADLESLTDEELERIHQEFCRRAENTGNVLESRRDAPKRAAHRAKTSATKSSSRQARATRSTEE